jgi:hypothetical protein
MEPFSSAAPPSFPQIEYFPPRVLFQRVIPGAVSGKSIDGDGLAAGAAYQRNVELFPYEIFPPSAPVTSPLITFEDAAVRRWSCRCYS